MEFTILSDLLLVCFWKPWYSSHTIINNPLSSFPASQKKVQRRFGVQNTLRHKTEAEKHQEPFLRNLVSLLASGRSNPSLKTKPLGVPANLRQRQQSQVMLQDTNTLHNPVWRQYSTTKSGNCSSQHHVPSCASLHCTVRNFCLAVVQECDSCRQGQYLSTERFPVH